MKLSQLKIGDKITHYCSGVIVEGTVKKIVSPTHIITEHEGIMWGKDEYKNTAIVESTPLQKKYGKEVTPGAWYKGEEITV